MEYIMHAAQQTSSSKKTTPTLIPIVKPDINWSYNKKKII